MYAGEQHWGATLGAAIIGGALGGVGAWHDLPLVAAAGAAVVAWVAWRMVRLAPSPHHTRPGPTAWSPYDRRRSGRVRLRQWVLHWLRPRRAVPDASSAALPGVRRSATFVRQRGSARRSRERGAH